MSKDIRSFFQPKKERKPEIQVIDDDVIPESPDVNLFNKKKEARKKRVLSDSDDEIFSNKKTKNNDSESKKQSQKNKKTIKSPQKLKEVKVTDLFGNTKIRRSEPIVKKEKKTEIGIHSDDDFDKSLLELDGIDTFACIPKLNGTDVGKTESKYNNNVVIEKNHGIGIKNGNSDIKAKDNNVEVLEDKLNKDSDKDRSRTSSGTIKHKPKDHKRDTSQLPPYETSNETMTKTLKTDVQESCKSKKRKLDDTHINNQIVMSENHKEQQKEKTDFSVFLENESGTELNESRSKKQKGNKSMNESMLTDEERHERKMQSHALYQKYLNRSGPKNLGAKEIPEGSKDCLKDCAFLLTGVLDSFERDEVAEAITRYGGSIKNSISKKVTHVLAGEDAGPAKMAKAQELGIRIINEDEFLQLIIDNSKQNNKNDIKKETKEKGHELKAKKDKHKDRHITSENNSEKKSEKSHKHTEITSENKSEKKSEKSHKHTEEQSSNNVRKVKSHSKVKKETEDIIKINDENDVDIKSITDSRDQAKSSDSVTTNSISRESSINYARAHMWVEKYKPQNLKQIIGQHGDNSNVKKLTNWLTKWYTNRKVKLTKPSPWTKNDDGAYFKAALLSGPPGVGKTTTVSLVCKELGFDMVEFNASDTRSKNLIKEQIGELVTTTSLSGFAKGETGKQAVTKKHVLVMDEVDGMAGNEDRGGMQELIAMIKATSVPVICMCNDRHSQKMKSLLNYVYELKFSRPNVNQIKAAMLSICSKENIKIPAEELTQLIVACGRDVRQTLNVLSMWAVDLNLADKQHLGEDLRHSKRDVRLGPWEAVLKVFSAEEHKRMSLNDRSDLFFSDYSLAPLFVQENYLSAEPHCNKREVLDRVSKAADSISAGDLVDAKIRGSQAWSLLPLQAMYSSVIPGHHMAGHLTRAISFPAWLGKNSRANKMHRLCQEIHSHTRLSTTGSKSSIFLDYCVHLRDAIVTPLVHQRAEGVPQALLVLDTYHLLKDDLDSLGELALWPGQRDPMVLVDSKVKASLTRTYNKSATALPYAPAAVKRRRRDAGEEEGDEETQGDADGDGQVEEDNEDSDVDSDAFITKKKSKENNKPSTSKEKPKSSKGKKK